MAKQMANAVSAPAQIDLSAVRLPLGRPVDPTSERQKRLAEMDIKRVAGLLHRGRPADPESPSFQKKQARVVKMEQGIELRRGRPVVPDSNHQQVLAKRRARLELLQQQYIAQQQHNATLVQQVKGASAIKAAATKTTKTN